MTNAFARIGLSAFLLSAVVSIAGQTTNDTHKAAVEHVLRAQQDAWNRHDLDGFMAG